MLSVLIGVALGLVALIGYGLSDYFGAISSKKIGGFQSAAVSRAIALIALTPLLFVFKIPPLTPMEIVFLVAAGVLVDLGLITFYKALKEGSVAIATPISSAYPVVTVILLLVFFNTQLSGLQEACIFLIILGTVLASFKYENLRKLKFTKFVKGSEFATLSMLFIGAGLFLEVILVKDLGWFVPALLIYFVALLCNILYSASFGVKFAGIGKAIPWAALAGITAVMGVVAFNYGAFLNYAVIVTPLSGASAILTVLLAFVLLKEKLDKYQMFGIALVLLGTIVLSII